MKNSGKWKNAAKGNNRTFQTEETKTKIKEITTTYFNNNENITKHRNIMSSALGIKVIQYNTNILTVQYPDNFLLSNFFHCSHYFAKFCSTNFNRMVTNSCIYFNQFKIINASICSSIIVFSD